MNWTLRILLILVLLAPTGFAQKEAPMPKDLPPYGPEKPVQAPSVKAEKLDNGLTVWLVSEPGFPKIALTVAIRGGFAADPGNRPGISELLLAAVDQGTKKRTAKQVAQDFQAAGGDLNGNATKDDLEMSTVILSSKLDLAMNALADVLQNATFPDAEVALAKRNLTDSLEQREAEPFFLAQRARDQALYKDHPYHVVAATKESVAAATAGELREIYAQRLRPDQAVLVAVGDFQNDKMLETIKANLGAWKAPSTAPVGAAPVPSPSLEHAVFVVKRPGSVQTTVEMATFGPRRNDADYAATQVANAIYGGAFSSRLITNIREDKGYTYSPFAFLSPFQESAELVTHADVRNEVTAPSLNEIQYELNRLATTSPTDEELSKAKHFLLGLEALRLQDRGSVAGRLATLWISGLPPEEIGIYGQKVGATTAADVNAAAKKYFVPYRATIIAVGEEQVIRDAVSPLGLEVRTTP